MEIRDIGTVFDDYIEGIDRRLRNEHERILEEGLKPYGITRENILEQRERVFVDHICRPSNPFQKIDNVRIDGKYAFSIETNLIFGGTRVDVNVRLIRGGADEEK